MNAQIGLINPKYPHNLGSIVRIAGCYNIDRIWYTGKRMDVQLKHLGRLPREERLRAYQNVKWENNDFFINAAKATPVAVEFDTSHENLVHFEHPPNAIYIFGPEDGSIPKGIRTACHRFVRIPTLHCLNLAMAVSTVIYDRHAKALQLMAKTGTYL